MVLELYIWGPAFGLPSIDAQCLATVAYFIHCLPPTEWRLISSGPLVGPAGMKSILLNPFQRLIEDADELPALRVDSTWICGFRGVVTFLREHSFGRWDLDEHLNKKQRADSLA